MRTKNVCAVLLGVVLAAGSLGGCQSSHQMRAADAGKVTVCRACYDKAVEVWEQGGYGGARWGYVPTRRIRVEHECPECGTGAVVHTDDGRWMITCPRCAPQGVPCDKCLPPEGASRAAAAQAAPSPKQSR